MKVSSSLVLIVVAAHLAGFTGCNQKSESTTADTHPAASTASEDHGHDHGAVEAHDHSVAGHAHGEGPHDGTIADWGGGKYHVEFTVDHDKQEATVYVLGGDEKTPSPITTETIELVISSSATTVSLKAAPQEGDPEGSASRFVGNHESLGVVQEYAGTITGVIDGTPYTGDFQEIAHEH